MIRAPRRPRGLTVATVSVLLLGVVSLNASAEAPANGPAPEVGTAARPQQLQGPGKADADGDRIADDLERAVADRTPQERVPVIVQGVSAVRAARAVPSLRVRKPFDLITGFAGSVPSGRVRALARLPRVTFVELDGVSFALDAGGERDYGVRAARSATPSLDTDGALDGSGVGICIVDTGIDPAHEQLSGRVDGWVDFVNGRATPYDDHGHGTHVAGIAAGDGTGSNASAADSGGGVARSARVYAAKVLDSGGTGADSDVVLGIEWCADQPGVDVISLSLGSPGGNGSDAASMAATAAVGSGVVVVAAAGNDGDGATSIAAPGVAEAVITVGAASDYSTPVGSAGHDDGLVLAGFSSRGPTVDGRMKPDIVAPGVTVVSAKAGTTSGYVSYSGTSMATPFVAGVVALGLDAVPSATPTGVKAALHASALRAGAAGPDGDWGWGMVDARAFIDVLKGVSPVTHAPWPDHQLIDGSVATNGTTNLPIEVTRSGEPLGLSIRLDGTARCVLDLGPWGCFAYEFSPDLDVYLLDPSGSQVAMSRCPLESTNDNCASMGRWESLGVPSAAAGTWTLRVVPDSASPNNGMGGTFQVDVFGALGASPQNSSPSAGDDDATTQEDTATTVNVVANDSDPDADSLTVTSFAQGAHGAVTAVAGGLRYTPEANWWGTDTFGYTVSDGRGGTASAVVRVTVRAVNDAPVARNDSGVTVSGSAITVTVVANDSDVDGDPLAVVAVGTPSSGTVTYSGGAITFTPVAGFSGTDTFPYTVSDSHGGFATALVTITVSGAVNTVPKVSIIDPDGVDDGAATVRIPAGKTRVKVTLTAVPDPDPAETGDTYTYQWKRGTKVLAATGPTMSQFRRAGTYRYSVTLNDGRGNSATDSIVITVR